ncbi:MAG: hypothetical protein JNM24_09660 [Bdellovibrionaceae bacterium]|nr:hypothetical protein [Pseudobdellovibrionaceae bacterium]
MKAYLLFCLMLVVSIPSFSQSKKKVVRKVQEVNFSEMSIKGTIRNPDGAFLVQKKGIKFMPLVDVQKNMDKKIREASFYVR